jgi:soluble cytochrome b562
MVRVLSLSIGMLLLSVDGFGQQQGPTRPFPFMQEMEQPFRELRAQIKDPMQNASSIDLIRRVEREALSAKNTVPPVIENLPPKQYQARLLAYRKLMLKLIREALSVEEHLLEGDNVKARAALIAMIETRREGHKAFTKSGPLD